MSLAVLFVQNPKRWGVVSRLGPAEETATRGSHVAVPQAKKKHE